MPARLLREGILTSEAVDRLSVHAELLYRRLMSVADDWGLFHGNPKLIRAACYPLRLDQVSDDDIVRWIDECVAAGLIARCAFDGKPVIAILRFGQQQRSSTSKYLPKADAASIQAFLRSAHGTPTPPTSPTPPPTGPAAGANGPLADAKQMPTGAHLVGVAVGVAVEGVDGVEGGVVITRAPAHARTIAPVPETWADWASWWKQERGIETTVRDRKAFVPMAERWIAAGVTTDQMRDALLNAESGASSPITYLPAYVDRVLASMQRPPDPRDVDLGQFLGSLTGGLAGTPKPPPETFDVAPARPAPRRIG